MTDRTSCIICNGNEFRPIFDNTLKRCCDCGFVTANMDISEETLKSTYSLNYFMGEEYMDYLKDKDILQLNFEKKIRIIRKLVKGEPGLTNCLEIGSAFGFFGEVLLKHFRTQYTGVDVVKEAADYGKSNLRLNMISGDYLRISAPSELYTDVFLWDVIEHLQYPQLFLHKAFNEMAAGGRIYISTGDISGLLPRVQGKRWRMIHPPSHIHYFSASHLQKLLQQSGFHVIHTSYVPVYRSLRQIYYSLFLLKKTGKISSKLFNLIPSQWHIPINTYDIVFMAAIKNNPTPRHE